VWGNVKYCSQNTWYTHTRHVNGYAKNEKPQSRDRFLRWVHTCNVTSYRNAVTLQVPDTKWSYDLNFHPVPHGVTASCERYIRRFPVCYGSLSDVFAASSGFVDLYTLRFKEKEKRAAMVAKTTVHKQGSVQRFTFAGRLEFSVGQWFI
jgi:hypothetical protein